jgi:hypothetical protein
MMDGASAADVVLVEFGAKEKLLARLGRAGRGCAQKLADRVISIRCLVAAEDIPGIRNGAWFLEATFH